MNFWISEEMDMPTIRFIQQSFGRIAGWVFICLAVYGAALIPRLLDSPYLRSLFLQSREVLQATPDAYYWLAGGPIWEQGGAVLPAHMLTALADMFSLSVEVAAFWAPAWLSAFVAIVGAGWGALLAERNQRIGAAVITALCLSLAPGVFARTRLGFYDTDSLILVIPLAFGLLLAWRMSRAQMVSPQLERPSGPSVPVTIFLAVCGMTTNLFAGWHGLMPACLFGLFVLGALMLPLIPHSAGRRVMVWELWIIGVFAFINSIAGCVIVFLSQTMGRADESKGVVRWAPTGVLVGVLFITLAAPAMYHGATIWTPVNAFWERSQSKAVSTVETQALEATPLGSASYPPMAHTIAEAQKPAFLHMLFSWHVWAGVSLAGLLGFIWVVRRKPASLFLAPLLLFGLFAPWLGERVAIFAMPAVAIGIALPLCELLSRVFAGRARRAFTEFVCIAIAVLLAAPNVYFNLSTPLTSALSKGHARALRALAKEAPRGGVVWDWWDFGHAARYYSGLFPFSDGGRQGPEYVYTMGKVYAAGNGLQAGQVIKFSAAFDGMPWNKWNRYSGKRVDEFMVELGREDKKIQYQKPQYLVVSRDALLLAPLILSFGSWSMEQEGGTAPLVEILPSDAPISFDAGQAPLGTNGTVALKQAFVLVSKSRRIKYDYAGDGRLTLICWPEGRMNLLLDERALQSALVQLMLFGEGAAGFEGFGRLLVDEYPDARVYEVR